MNLGLPRRKVVLEVRYPPRLAFYTAMDSLGQQLLDKFPKWVRTPQTLELLDPDRHRRLFLSHSRCFYDADAADQPGEVDFAAQILGQVLDVIAPERLERVGLRQFFVADLDKSFELMVDELNGRFLSGRNTLLAIAGDEMTDLSLLADFETESGLKYHLRLGPMVPDQFFEIVPHETRLFAPTRDNRQTWLAYRESFPEAFLFIDLDYYREDCSVGTLKEFLRESRQHAKGLVHRLVDSCK